MQTQTIVAQSFSTSKQKFFDQPLIQLTNDGAHCTGAPLAARGTATCSCVKTCKISWQIYTPAKTLTIKVNLVQSNGAEGLWNSPQTVIMESGEEETKQDYNFDEYIRFWLGFSTACGPSNQIVIYKDSQKLRDISIYAREQAIISSNSLTDQFTSNSVTVSPLETLSQDVSGQMFDCFVDQDVVNASSDLYHSLVIENQYIDDKNYPYGIEYLEIGGQLRPVSNLFYETTLYNGSNAIKVFYPNKFMLAWKFATEDSFMRGYNLSKLGVRTNIQVQIGFKSIDNICSDEPIRSALIDQIDLKYFKSTRYYPNVKNSKFTPLTYYLCDGIVRIMFDDNPDLQVLSLEVIGEIGGSAIRSG
ncbi:MAG: hypothetical protein EZS28_000731 [Streblomastix strix]|uniref:Uncharacterized protein n=1 Tax=Streblomastix strix TaxID=222440 RepID=A0A5J4XB52_9EUKA|nr:MAG: hypothetical protein EZS28_000731 [Streblomastix strix]